MTQPVTQETPAYFFLTTKEAVLGTPASISASKRTIDKHFHDLANDYDLQTRLHLLSAALLRPHFRPPISIPMEGQELIEHAATYLAAFCDDPDERRERREYLVNNGIVRILVTDDSIFHHPIQ